jgi:hypothetical protein
MSMAKVGRVVTVVVGRREWVECGSVGVLSVARRREGRGSEDLLLAPSQQALAAVLGRASLHCVPFDRLRSSACEWGDRTKNDGASGMRREDCDKLDACRTLAWGSCKGEEVGSRMGQWAEERAEVKR